MVTASLALVVVVVASKVLTLVEVSDFLGGYDLKGGLSERYNGRIG